MWCEARGGRHFFFFFLLAIPLGGVCARDVRTCSRSAWAHIPGLDRRRAFRAVEAGGTHQADGDGDGPHDAAVRAGGAGGRGLGGRRAEEPRGALEGLGDVGGALRAVVALRAVGAGLIPGLPVGSVAVGTSRALDGGDGGLRAVAALGTGVAVGGGGVGAAGAEPTGGARRTGGLAVKAVTRETGEGEPHDPDPFRPWHTLPTHRPRPHRRSMSNVYAV